MNAIDFAWPSGFIGRSSGWSERRSPQDTMGHPPIVPRREVGLVRPWRGLRVPVDGAGRFQMDGVCVAPIHVKVEPERATLKGLSSGASSALLREADGTVTRIKRCGFAFRGVGPRTGFVGRIGMMSVAEAIQECRMLARFRAQGLCAACEPLSVDVLADPKATFFKEHASAAARIRVTSDVRADEWLLHGLREALCAAGLAEPVFTIHDDERVSLRLPAQALPVLRAMRPYPLAAELGRGLGGLLRAVHDAGLLRGRGSVWMGNDIVGPDGVLSAVDADGGALDARGSVRAMARIEAVEYAAGFSDCFSWAQPDWLAEIATVLHDAYWDGYNAAAAPVLRSLPVALAATPAGSASEPLARS